jgi:hypothetical protein
MHCQRKVRWIKNTWRRCHALHRQGLHRAGPGIEEYLIPSHLPLLVRTRHTPPTAIFPSIQINHLPSYNLNLDLQGLQLYYGHTARLPRKVRSIQLCHLQQSHPKTDEVLRWVARQLTTRLFRVLDYSRPRHLILLLLLSTALGCHNLAVLASIPRISRHQRRLTLLRLNTIFTLATS